jgi:hypothetical protein
MTSFKNIALAVGLIAGYGCRSHPADQAADKVTDKGDDLRDERTDMANKKVDEMKESRKVVESSNEMTNANADFEAKRDIRVQSLEAELAATSLQPKMINAITDNFPLTAASRADVTDKLQALQMRFDEARNQVEGLKKVSPDTFKDADDKTRDAFDKLHDARKAAWDAIKDAHRTDRSS